MAALAIPHSSEGKTASQVHNTSQHSPAQPSPVSPTTPPPTQPAQKQAAESLAALLAQSATARTSIVNAVSDIDQCGPSLSQDAQTLQSAATSRQHLLSQLADLPGRPALPAPMLQALTTAWQESVQADQDLARWAQDEVARGCTQNDHSDANYQAATGPDNQATTDKKTFVNLWKPIAAQYGLPTFGWDQL